MMETNIEKLSPVLREKYPAISSVFKETYVLDFLNHLKPFSKKGNPKPDTSLMDYGMLLLSEILGDVRE